SSVFSPILTNPRPNDQRFRRTGSARAGVRPAVNGRCQVLYRSGACSGTLVIAQKLTHSASPVVREDTPMLDVDAALVEKADLDAVVAEQDAALGKTNEAVVAVAGRVKKLEDTPPPSAPPSGPVAVVT